MTMIIRRLDELRALVTGWKRSGEVVGVVPTMGALHAGNVLIKASIFMKFRRY